MNNIVKKENLQINLDRLDAQRNLYSRVKIYAHLLTFLCVVVPVLIAITKIVWTETTLILRGAVVYSFVLLFLRPCLKSYVGTLQNLAARIQQQFDCDVFDLEWNEPLCGKQPDLEQIFAKKTGKKIDGLQNWYEVIVEKLDRLEAIVVCQRINVPYDKSLRETFSLIIKIVVGIAGLFVLMIGFLHNSTLWDWFLNAIVPVSPVISWYMDLHKQNHKNVMALEKLNQLIDSALRKLRNGDNIEEQNVISIQNFMFIHRSSSYVIPDFIYKLRRNKHEEATRYSVAHIVEELVHG